MLVNRHGRKFEGEGGGVDVEGHGVRHAVGGGRVRPHEEPGGKDSAFLYRVDCCLGSSEALPGAVLDEVRPFEEAVGVPVGPRRQPRVHLLEDALALEAVHALGAVDVGHAVGAELGQHAARLSPVALALGH